MTAPSRPGSPSPLAMLFEVLKSELPQYTATCFVVPGNTHMTFIRKRVYIVLMLDDADRSKADTTTLLKATVQASQHCCMTSDAFVLQQLSRQLLSTVLEWQRAQIQMTRFFLKLTEMCKNG